jgi:hypothetical protein
MQISVTPTASRSTARKLKFWLPVFVRIAAIQIIGFQRIFHALKILHASLQYVFYNKLNLIEVKERLHAPYQRIRFFMFQAEF